MREYQRGAICPKWNYVNKFYLNVCVLSLSKFHFIWKYCKWFIQDFYQKYYPSSSTSILHNLSVYTGGARNLYFAFAFWAGRLTSLPVSPRTLSTAETAAIRIGGFQSSKNHNKFHKFQWILHFWHNFWHTSFWGQNSVFMQVIKMLIY